MTDVPFTALVVISLLVMFRALEHDTNVRLLGSTLIVTVCILCRQLGLVLPAAFAVCFVARYGITARSIARGAVPLVAGFGAFLGYRWWAAAAGCLGHLDWSFGKAVTDLIEADAARAFALRTAGVGLCSGLFVFPFALTLPFPDRTWTRSRGRRWERGAGGLRLAGAAARLWHGETMPVLRNVLAPHGIGPVMLRDVDVLKLSHVLPLPKPFWLVATIFSVLGGGILLACFVLSALRLPLRVRPSAGNTPRLSSCSCCWAAWLISCPYALSPFMIAT